MKGQKRALVAGPLRHVGDELADGYCGLGNREPVWTDAQLTTIHRPHASMVLEVDARVRASKVPNVGAHSGPEGGQQGV